MGRVHGGDAYLYPNGTAIPYPPLHPHHSNYYLVGGPKHLMPKYSSTYRDFRPLSILDVDEYEEGYKQRSHAYPASSNVLGYNADLVGCQVHSDGAPCFYS